MGYISDLRQSADRVSRVGNQRHAGHALVAKPSIKIIFLLLKMCETVMSNSYFNPTSRAFYREGPSTSYTQKTPCGNRVRVEFPSLVLFFFVFFTYLFN